ncbi:MAG: ATP-binding protein, partial [Gemmataceae bacterium]|nr:ATP-binding protein [Gemmataceae bacterium]
SFDVIGNLDADISFGVDFLAYLLKKFEAMPELGQAEEQTLYEGQRRTVRVIKTPVKDDAGQNVGVLGIFWDITDQLAMETQLRHVQKMDAVGQLAGGVAHDFNNLLTVILGNLSFVLSKPEPWAGLPLEMLRHAEQAGLRAADLTQRLLGFSRRTMLRAEALDLNQAVEDTVRMLRRTIDPRIEFVLHLWPRLGRIKADAGMVHQVVMNLVLNARDAMPEGGTLTIDTGHFQPDEEYLRRHVEARTGTFARLRVRDTGDGMTPEIRQRIFEPFFTTKEVGKGTGLGLAMIFGIVKQHHGWIVCDSAPGQGTTFDIFWPQFQGDPAGPAVTPTANLDGNETILIVDDDPMIRNLASMILRRFGYQVVLAEDGLDALAKLRQPDLTIDLVILDGTMPRLSGRDTLREMIDINPQVRVLFSSGYSNDYHDLSGFPQIVGFIQKPYRVDDLANKVRFLLDSACRS